jgi:hypothetical protein
VAAAVSQPDPIPTSGPAIADLVLADLTARKAEGIRRYGVPLQAHNGRDALQDAYEEALDLALYLRQAIEERRPADQPSVYKLDVEAGDTVVVECQRYLSRDALDRLAERIKTAMPDGCRVLVLDESLRVRSSAGGRD